MTIVKTLMVVMMVMVIGVTLLQGGDAAIPCCGPIHYDPTCCPKSLAAAAKATVKNMKFEVNV